MLFFPLDISVSKVKIMYSQKSYYWGISIVLIIL